ncbi:RQC domain-containing protein [Deminuibacter soli]|uniref:RQC domain-containing protein n=1 Tax=Deminuibacter soli TaxID=2291815 RepID=UPI001FEC1771|nr:RQC domain-containing protein [Deminuibacter soli]
MLSAVTRLEERFGINYIIDFLRGSSTVKEMHQTLKTFGIGKETGKEEWRACIKDLLHTGYLQQSEGEYPVLQLTAASWDVLRGQQSVLVTSFKKKEQPQQPATEEGGAVLLEKDLLQQLKQLRKTIAAKENMPPYIIFSDATLVELATYLPLVTGDLSRISGFGEVKMDRYGNDFLECVQDYCILHKLPTRIQQRQDKKLRYKR